MKRYIIAIWALFMALAVRAEISEKALLVNMKNGNETEFKFSSTPVATFDGAEMKITADNGSTVVTMPVADVEKMTIVDTESGVTEIAAANRATFIIRDSEILGAGFDPNTGVTLYSLAGVLLAQTAADDNGCFSLTVPDGAKGTYIVKAGDRSFKFIK